MVPIGISEMPHQPWAVYFLIFWYVRQMNLCLLYPL